MLTAIGPDRAAEQERWDAWKGGFFRQHPIFQDMLADPTRNQRRRDALEQLTTLAASPDLVDDDLAELIGRFDDFRLNISGLRGDRRRAVVRRRQAMTEEFDTYAKWLLQRAPHLSGLYLQLIEPELVDLDDDGVVVQS
jgi:hypothetical protein